MRQKLPLKDSAALSLDIVVYEIYNIYEITCNLPMNFFFEYKRKR